MAKLDCILVYHWQAWDGFLISHLVADYCHLPASHEDGLAQLERHLTPNICAVLPQINLTDSGVFPAQRAALFAHLKARGVAVLNTEVNNISKRQLHRMLAQAGLPCARATESGPAQQRLFVKTDLNWGGASERRLSPALQGQLLSAHARVPVRDELHAGDAAGTIRGWDGYYTMLRKEVPPALWHDPALVIEQYIENPEHSFYRVYGFGDSLVVVKAHSNALIKKLAGDARDSNVLLQRDALLQDGRATQSCGRLPDSRTLPDSDVLPDGSGLPPGLRRVLRGFVQHCPLAYFCLDIVHDEREFYIIDLNLTPWAGKQPQTSEAVEFLCRGAVAYLKHHAMRRAA